MVHDLQVSQQLYKISRNVGNLIDHFFKRNFATKHTFGVNPRDARIDRRDYVCINTPIISPEEGAT